MGTTSSFFGGGGSSAPLPHYVFTNNVSGWSPPHNGTMYVHVIGAGGNGSADTSFNTVGAAAGYSRKLITVTTSDSYNLTVGAPSNSASGTGASSVFTDSSSITLTSVGGGLNTPGTASGGDVNYTGGNGGAGGGSASRMPGGGAVNLTGTAYNGGVAYQYASSCFAFGGGAGIGGGGGGTYTTSNGRYAAGGGGGSGGTATASPQYNNAQDGYYISGGRASIGKPYGVVGFDFIKEWGAGGGRRWSSSSSVGSLVAETVPGVGGGGAGGFGNQDNHGAGQDGGMFGGGGGRGGNGGFGGGGGGAFNYAASSGSVYIRGQGGPGIIFVEYVTLT